MAKNMCVKVDDELYEKIKQRAESDGISLSDFMRDALMKRTCDSHELSDAPQATAHEDYMQLHERYMSMVEQLQSDLSEQSKRHDMIVAQMTTQLERSQLQLADLRQHRSFWQRLIGKKG
jgi:negative regulator of replication initiation